MGVPSPGIAAHAELLAELIGGERAYGAARRLLAALGSLGRVMAAPAGAIARLAGDNEVAKRISAARDAVLAGQREEVLRTPFDLRDARLQSYLVGLFQGLAVERMHVIFLDAARHYLVDERLADGTGTEVAGCLRTLVARSFDLGAAGVVLAHNHPSGIAAPSEADIHETRRLSHSLADLDLILVDHLIVGGTTIHSMRGSGLL
jgi:DNA repair protein RadC